MYVCDYLRKSQEQKVPASIPSYSTQKDSWMDNNVKDLILRPWRAVASQTRQPLNCLNQQMSALGIYGQEQPQGG